MTDRLKLYNGALRKLGETRLANVTENVKGRRILDECYEDIVGECLEAGYWNFAMRSARFDPTPSEQTAFGVQHIYNKPDDWIRTYSFCSDEQFKHPVLDYQDLGQSWVTDCSPVYIQWTSSEKSYGGDLGRWPQRFVKYVQLSLAVESCEEITGSSSKQAELMQEAMKALKKAQNLDALNDPVTRFPPVGRLVSSRGEDRWRGEGRYKAG